MGRGPVPSQQSNERGCLDIIGTLLLLLFSIVIVSGLIQREEANCEMLGELFEVEAEARWLVFCQYQEDGMWVDLTLKNLRD